MAKKKAKEQERLEERGRAIFFPDYNALKERRKAARQKKDRAWSSVPQTGRDVDSSCKVQKPISADFRERIVPTSCIGEKTKVEVKDELALIEERKTLTRPKLIPQAQQQRQTPSPLVQSPKEDQFDFMIEIMDQINYLEKTIENYGLQEPD